MALNNTCNHAIMYINYTTGAISGTVVSKIHTAESATAAPDFPQH